MNIQSLSRQPTVSIGGANFMLFDCQHTSSLYNIFLQGQQNEVMAIVWNILRFCLLTVKWDLSCPKLCDVTHVRQIESSKNSSRAKFGSENDKFMRKMLKVRGAWDLQYFCQSSCVLKSDSREIPYTYHGCLTNANSPLRGRTLTLSTY